MLTVSTNDIITVNRGDSFSLNVLINIGTQLEPIIYYLEENDSLYFGLTEPNQPFEHALIRKELKAENQDENGLVCIDFKASDTERIIPGGYYYTIKLVRRDGENEIVDTITPKTKFFIIE